MNRHAVGQRSVVILCVSLLMAACSAAGTPSSISSPPSGDATPGTPGATARPTLMAAGSEPGGSTLTKRGFPETCPEVSESFDLLNRASYQVFAEQVLRDAQGQAGLVHAFLGTAWAVGDRLLATNAHVAETFAGAAAEGVQFSRAIAVQSGTGAVIRLVRGFTHPDYDPNALLTPDVGLFESEQVLPAMLLLRLPAGHLPGDRGAGRIGHGYLLRAHQGAVGMAFLRSARGIMTARSYPRGGR